LLRKSLEERLAVGEMPVRSVVRHPRASRGLAYAKLAWAFALQ
jgi:hypothetical protein